MLSLPADRAADSHEPVVIMWSDSGIEVLAEDRTYLLPKESLRDLLFFSNRVFLTVDGERMDHAFALVMPFPKCISFWIDGVRHVIHRSRLIWVARGDVPVDRLRRAEAC